MKQNKVYNRDRLKDKRLTRGDLSVLRQPRGILLSNGASHLRLIARHRD